MNQNNSLNFSMSPHPQIFYCKLVMPNATLASVPNINKRQILRGSGYSAQTPRKHSPIKSRTRENRQRSLKAEKVKKRIHRASFRNVALCSARIRKLSRLEVQLPFNSFVWGKAHYESCPCPKTALLLVNRRRFFGRAVNYETIFFFDFNGKLIFHENILHTGSCFFVKSRLNLYLIPPTHIFGSVRRYYF